MGKINLLSTEISNKIAAGEVVERPVSVVKELVENSIDAGADVITVEIRNGGTTLIKVADNGSGMSEEDAKTAFLRHATSKIATEADLDAIFTLGFRGEALSSIGAVSRADMYTKLRNEPVGTHVKCHGGLIELLDEAGCPDGTVFEIKDLFYNTPARMKFLKKDATEGAHITDLLVKYILSYPHISFRLISNGKQQLFSPGDNSLKNAVYTVYGRDYANAVIPVDYSIGNLRVSGMTGKGNLARPNRNFQSYFVNNRYIKSPLIIKAVEEAYKNQIMIGKYPVSILNIEVNPSLIDINVHPTKLEVKFSQEKEIYELVYYAVKNALYEVPNVPKIDIKPAEGSFIREDKGEQLSVSDLSKLIPKQDYKTRFNPFGEKKPDVKREVMPGKEPQAEPVKQQPPENAEPKKTEMPEYKDMSKATVAPSFDALAQFKAERTENENPVMLFKSSEPVPQESKAAEQPVADTVTTLPQKHTAEKPEAGIRICGQVFDTYIMAERGDELIIIDQHAAHERLKYEELKKSAADNKIFSQVFLEPVIITLSQEELAIYKENKEVFEAAGFETDEFGNRDIIVRGAPADLEWSDAESLVLELMTQLGENKKEIISKKQERFMYTIACKAAIKANHTLSADEMKRLVENVIGLENINTCPHGRPIMISMTKHEMEKQFKRIV